jgi:hypothetical protein
LRSNKLRSLRSTYWCLGIIALAIVGIAILMGIRWADVLATDPPGKGAGFDATNTVLGGVYIAQDVLGTLGVMTISSEYSTEMIRATFVAVPQRRTLLAAKLLVLAGSVLVLAEMLCFASFGLGQALLSRQGFGVSLADPGGAARGVRRRPLPHRSIHARFRPRRAHPAHRRATVHLLRRPVRAHRAQRPATDELTQSRRQLHAGQRRQSDIHRRPRPWGTIPLNRARCLLPLRRNSPDRRLPTRRIARA